MSPMRRARHDRRRLLARVCAQHGEQRTVIGRRPIWQHPDRVSRILESALASSGEGTPEERRRIALAALGHDLAEDTAIETGELTRLFGEEGARFIGGMTRAPGAREAEYVAQVCLAGEEVRLTKLADLVDNCLSVSYCLDGEAIGWVSRVYLPIVRAMLGPLQRTRFRRFPRTARALLDRAREAHRLVVEQCDRALLDGYLAQALDGLRTLSRTAGGKLDLSASPSKGEALTGDIWPDAARRLGIRNYREAIAWLFSIRGETPDRERVRHVVRAVAEIVNRGIVQEGRWLREHPAPGKGYAAPAHVPRLLEGFVRELERRLRTGRDPVRLAAWIEWQVDLKHHFFADGCGRTARALAAWVLMRAGLDLPQYGNRGAYYRMARGAFREFVAWYRRRVPRSPGRR